MVHSVHVVGEVVVVVSFEVAVRAVDVGLIRAVSVLRDDDGSFSGAERRRDCAGRWGSARDRVGGREGIDEDEG